DQIPFVIYGTGTPGASVTITVESKGSATGVVAPDGTWAVRWTTPLPTATYTITTTIGSETTTGLLRVQLPGTLQRQFPFEPRRVYGIPEQLHPENYPEITDRWRIAPPPYELDENWRGRWVPFNNTYLKAD